MKLTDNIHLLQIDFEIAISPEKRLPRFVNVIIIFGNKITLIDTGVKGSEKAIFDYIIQNGRDFSEIETVILSHSHPDHIGSAAKIRELTGCKILAHQAEREWIEDINIQNNQRPVPGFFNLVDTPVTLDGLINDQDELTADKGITLRFLHAPGHSKGSLNIFFKENRILFTADSIPLKNDIPNYDNFTDLMNSLDSIRRNTDYDLLLTSWTPPLRNADEIRSTMMDGEAYMKQIDAVVKECYGSISTATPDACINTVAKLGLPPFLANPIVDKAFRSHL